MQLFSVDQQRSQALEAHAASFAQFKVEFVLVMDPLLLCGAVHLNLGVKLCLILFIYFLTIGTRK